MAGGEIEEWERSIGRGFGEVLDKATWDVPRRPHEPERVVAAFDGGHIVGGANTYSLEIVVPGGRLPAAGVDNVSVHRRRTAEEASSPP